MSWTGGTTEAVLFGAAALAGAINAVAGGGTLVTFPALVWSGLLEKIANATSTVALWPGSMGGLWGYRRELHSCPRWMFLLVVPSVVGGVTGAWLLLGTRSETFGAIVPYLILFATLLFLLQEPIVSAYRSRLEQPPSDADRRPAGWAIVSVFLLQTVIAIYGGYFGAGIGILMLSTLSLLRIGNIHLMNGLKSLLAMCINGVAAGCFIYSGIIDDWTKAGAMIVGAVTGGYGGARVARALGQRAVRRAVVCIGFAIAARMLLTR
jgi:hypothetical protein